MVKIKKGLSDAEMLKGYVEEDTSCLYDGNATLNKKKVAAKKAEAQMPEDQIERLNRFLTEIGMERMMKKLPAAGWQVNREGDAIIIRAKTI